MKLVEQQVGQFTQALASEAPAPGGGSASALMGAQGAALIAMVCALTAGKEKYAQHQTLAENTRRRASELQARLLEAVDRDTEAFLTISSAYAMAKTTAEEKAARSAAIQRGLETCTRSPLGMMALASEALDLAEGLLGRFNENAASDLGVAVLSLAACARGAWLNVLINVGSLKDQALAQSLRRQGEGLLEKILLQADRTYQQIVQML